MTDRNLSIEVADKIDRLLDSLRSYIREDTAALRSLAVKLDTELAESQRLRDRVARLEGPARNLLALLDRVSAKATHDAFCNGVHSTDGQCEGEHLLSVAMDDLSNALSDQPSAQTGGEEAT